MIIKPAGASCNLKCDYCYYRGKDSAASGTVMDEQFLERFVRTYIMSQPGPEVLFVWHGGEPLLRPLSFYRKAVELQEKYAGGMLIDNCLQTNGTLLDEDWCRFLRDNRWLVGISLDGPERFHDSYRRDTHGNPSFSKVMKSIEMMTRFGVEWNAMAVVNDYNSCHPLEFYRFFKSLGCRFLQFTPVTDRMSGGNIVSPSVRGAGPADFSVTSEGWGNFLCAVFDEWVKNDVGDVFVQIFDSALACWAGVPPSLCSMSSFCVRTGVLESNGDVYSCDHLVFPEYRIGNIMEENIGLILGSAAQDRFVNAKTSSLTRQCRECRFLFACNGDCPRNRFSDSIYGEPGHSCLCGGFQKFFAHVSPYMDFMKSELLAGRPASNVMDFQP